MIDNQVSLTELRPRNDYVPGLFQLGPQGQIIGPNDELLDMLTDSGQGPPKSFLAETEGQIFFRNMGEQLRQGSIIAQSALDLTKPDGTKLESWITAIQTVDENFVCVVQPMIRNEKNELVPKPEAMIPLCAGCPTVRLRKSWVKLSGDKKLLYKSLEDKGIGPSHVTCPKCTENLYGAELARIQSQKK
jgi:hypothetical protein